MACDQTCGKAQNECLVFCYTHHPNMTYRQVRISTLAFNSSKKSAQDEGLVETKS
jgi:hypothetical protein